MKNFFDFSRQCKYLKFKKTSGIEIEMPIHKRLVIDLLEGVAKRTPPPGSDRVKRKNDTNLPVVVDSGEVDPSVEIEVLAPRIYIDIVMIINVYNQI